MKRLLFMVSVLVFLSLGCNKIKRLTNIDVDLPPYTQQLDAADFPDSLSNPTLPPGGILIALPPVPLATNSKQYLDQYNTTPDKINSVTLKSIVLQMVQPTDKHLNFLRQVEVFLSADTLKQILVAHKYSITKGQNSVTLDDTSGNLKNYFLQDTVFVQIKAIFDSIPPHGTQVNAITTFHFSANPLN